MLNLIRALQTATTVSRAAWRTVGVFGGSVAITSIYGPIAVAGGFDLEVAGRWTRIWADTLTRGFGLGLDVSGSVPTGGGLVVSNHRSYVDIAALGSLVEACFIARADIQRWPILGPTFRISSTVFVDRENPDSGPAVRRQVAERLRRGLSIINFAEGTTHGGTGLLPFKIGLFKDIFGSPLPIVPTTITYSGIHERVEWIGDDTFLDHFLRLAGHRGLRAHVHFGEPLWANAFGSLDALVWAVRRRMLQDLATREPIAPTDYPELGRNTP